MSLHIPTAGMFCVPTAIELITGEDPQSVIFPALNRRHPGRGTLTGAVAGEFMHVAAAVLDELGYHVRKYKGNALGALVRDWAQRFPDHIVLISAGGKDERHCLVLHNGKVYDSWEPMGKEGYAHPFHNTRVNWAALIQKKS